MKWDPVASHLFGYWEGDWIIHPLWISIGLGSGCTVALKVMQFDMDDPLIPLDDDLSPASFSEYNIFDTP